MRRGLVLEMNFLEKNHKLEKNFNRIFGNFFKKLAAGNKKIRVKTR